MIYTLKIYHMHDLMYSQNSHLTQYCLNFTGADNKELCDSQASI